MDLDKELNKLNKQWVDFFKVNRLKWATSNIPNRLLQFLENLSFTDASVTFQEKGYVGESYHVYFIDLDFKSKIDGEIYNSSITTVDADTYSYDDGWVLTENSYLHLEDEYEGYGYMEGNGIHTLIDIDYSFERNILEIFEEFKLRPKIESFIYKLLASEEKEKAEKVQKELFSEPIQIVRVEHHRDYYKLITNDGTEIQVTSIRKKNDEGYYYNALKR